MRLTKVNISGFRGFSTNYEFEIDANAIIVIGANGRGKTSFFDAILWALTGSVPRLGDSSNIVSKYSESGETTVILTLRAPTGESLKVSRSYDGQVQRLRLEINGDTVAESEAEIRLLEKIWPEALRTANSSEALITAFTRSVYLQQDSVREFIDGDNKERFKSVSELVGVGRVTELQSAIERAKNAWTRATTTLEKELEETRTRRTKLKNQLSTLAEANEDENKMVDATWEKFRQKVKDLKVNISALDRTSLDPLSVIDEIMKQLLTIRKTHERRITTIRELKFQIKSREVPPLPNLLELKNKLEEADTKLQLARDLLTKAEVRAGEDRRRRADVREAQEELRTMAELALRHLGPRCPVCGQMHDQDITSQRLLEMVNKGNEPSESDKVDVSIKDLANNVDILEHARANADAIVKNTEAKLASEQIWLEERDRRLSEFNIPIASVDSIMLALTNLEEQFDRELASISSALSDGDSVALALASVSEFARRKEISEELQKIDPEVQTLENKLHDRQLTGELSSQILNGLRDAAYFVVENRLNDVEDLLQNVYATIDPHPAFRTVRFLTDSFRGQGLLDTQIKDSVEEVSSKFPAAILSSSQLNALAVSIFLSFNLAVKSLPLLAAILDDPLQSLDDINLLGVVDLLRRVKDNRQLFISTHDERFGKLLELKLRPIRNQKTIIIALTGWSRQGPTIEKRVVEPDAASIHILA